ncbi:hypothetical protein LC612_41315 [Nostoc sp. CHAB 5834]|nr:hypothetical protein [Nostoc sp. CHAB 5834]
MVSEATSQCKVCGKTFPYRRSKQFCSNACKQQAYLSSKLGVSLVQAKATNVNSYDFSLSEYTAYRKDTEIGMDLIGYCFLRRNLKGSADLQQVKDYFDGFFQGGYTWWDYFVTIKETKAYTDFTDDFLNSKYSVGA